ncbi:MAG: DUF1854 domain-containing protein [Fimbriimonadales bacterium]|nr:DUF1854 domain-containing protein [Fimbriimonadales bacterium]
MAFEEARYLDPAKVRAWFPEGSSRLRVEVEGEFCLPRAVAKLVFPLSHPDRHVVLMDVEGKEAGILPTLEGMEPSSREAFQRELDRRYFTPKILAIRDLKQDGGMWRFRVETQRGPTEFWVRHWRDNSAEIQPGRWQIQSVDGQRFEIPAIDALDVKSLRLLEQLL